MAETSGYGHGVYGTGLPYGIDKWGCLVTPISPLQDAVAVALDSNITLTIEDEDLIVPSSIMVEVDGGSGFEIAFRYADPTQFKTGWDGPASQVTVVEGKYTITIDPSVDLGPATAVQVRVTASDYTGNPERLP